MKKITAFFLIVIIFVSTSHSDDILYQLNNEYNPPKIVLFPIDKAQISLKIDAHIKKYYFKEGESFKEGDLIALMDDELYLNDYNRAKAEYEIAAANYDFVEKTYKHNLDLYKKGGLSAQEMEKVKLDRINAQSQLKIAEASMNVAAKRFNECKVIAPFSGRLTEKYIQEHEFARAGMPVMELINDNELLAIMYLPSDEISKINKKTPLSFKIDETSTIHAGKIYESSGYIYPGSRTFEVKAVIDNNSKKLYSGMSGTLLSSSLDTDR